MTAASDERNSGAGETEHGQRLSDYDYPLPIEQIAQQPLAQRDQSRLLVLDRAAGAILAHDTFAHVGDYLAPGDLLVLNETRVSATRLYGHLDTGARAEFLLTHRVQEGVWQCLARPGKRLRLGTRVAIDTGRNEGVDLTVEVAGIVDERGGRLVRIESSSGGGTDGTDVMIEQVGLTPLPPYIHADAPNQYKERYQTVYSRQEGSAAAPTAGLHFTPELLTGLRARGIETATVTLHVGIGTFRPIESENIAEHAMHEEQGEIPLETAEKVRAAKGRIIAVGTTSVRALESAAVGRRELRSGPFKTSLYVTPGYAFQIADAMITNFHMPRSTLLVLVSAFAGQSAILRAYRDALEQGYRFLSFGDAMLIIDPRHA